MGKSEKTPKNFIKRVRFLVAFRPKLLSLAKKSKEPSKYLHTDLELKTVFTSTPLVSFRSARKIRDYLVRTKLYSLEQHTGSTRSR